MSFRFFEWRVVGAALSLPLATIAFGCSSAPSATEAAASTQAEAIRTGPTKCGACEVLDCQECGPEDGCKKPVISCTCDPDPSQDGTSCSDGRACDLPGTCSGGACVSHGQKTCTAPDLCHTASCSSSTGACVSTPVEDGTPCGSGETCNGGVCEAVCSLMTCASQHMQCGKTGDGCGHIIDCGTCTAPETCGGGGIPSVCGAPICTRQTCAEVGASCGQQADGCGGLIDCGSCTAPQTCGGGGTPNKCGSSPVCVPKTCADYPPGTCGQQADGCGGATPNCHACTAPETCGGNGVWDQCGYCGGYGWPACPSGCNPGLTNVNGVCGCATGTLWQNGVCCGALGGTACTSTIAGRGDGCSQGVNQKGTCVACGQEAQPPCADGLCKAICSDKSCQGTFNPNLNTSTMKNVCTATCGYAPTHSYDMPCTPAMANLGYCEPDASGVQKLVFGEPPCLTESVSGGVVTETQYSCYNHSYVPLSNSAQYSGDACVDDTVSNCPVGSVTLGNSGIWTQVFSAPPAWGATCPVTALNGGVTAYP
jgi:hypothetical protein